jgi:hypothetical protein
MHALRARPRRTGSSLLFSLLGEIDVGYAIDERLLSSESFANHSSYSAAFFATTFGSIAVAES